MLLKVFISLGCMFARVAVGMLADTRNDICIPYNEGTTDGGIKGGNTMITIINVVTIETIYFPVIVNSFIQENTVLNFGGGVRISVTNAPTQIMTIATGSSAAELTAVTTMLPGNINIFQTINVINFPVVISTLIQQNTIIQAGGGINIIINNAPTFLLTTATGTSTVTATVTSTVTTNDSQPTTFLLSPVAAGVVPRNFRRQAPQQQFISPAGTIIASCLSALTFAIIDGQLKSGGNVFSTNIGVDSAPFVASQTIGNISNTFIISDILTWSNSAFSGGKARFCLANSRVNALFTSNATIPGCITQSLFVIPAASCENSVIVPPSSSLSSSSSTTTMIPIPTSGTSSSVSFTEDSTISSAITTSPDRSISPSSTQVSIAESSTSLSSSSSMPSSSSIIPATTGCSGESNDLQRCFAISSVSASSFCSIYLNIPAGPATLTESVFITLPSNAATVTSVFTSIITLTKFSTEVATTTSTSFTTSLYITTAIETSTAFSTAVDSSISITVFFTETTLPPMFPEKRAVTTLFGCISLSGVGIYTPVSISSACSCLIVLTGTLTDNFGTVTETDYFLSTISTATTSTQQVQETLITSTTLTVVQTVVITSYVTFTTMTPIPAITSTTTFTTRTETVTSISTPSCELGTAVIRGPFKFNRYFSGTGVSENPNNPGNVYLPPVSTTFSRTLSCADVAQACLDFTLMTPGPYLSFDLHYLLAEQEWACIAYYNSGGSAAFFNVLNPNIGVSFGFQY